MGKENAFSCQRKFPRAFYISAKKDQKVIPLPRHIYLPAIFGEIVSRKIGCTMSYLYDNTNNKEGYNHVTRKTQPRKTPKGLQRLTMARSVWMAKKKDTRKARCYANKRSTSNGRALEPT